MNKSEQFNKWYAEHCGHPHHVRFAKGAIDEQQQEIALQNAQLLDANNEIMALKAMVNALHQKLADFDAYSNTDMGYRISPFGKTVVELLNKTPAQCLASVKADVIKSTISDIEIGMANAHLDGDDILVYLNLELGKLREQK